MGKKYTVEAKWIGKKYISLENLHNHKYKKKEHKLSQKRNPYQMSSTLNIPI
jgi:hypothetical protein